jgi:DNA-binding SARP family transcriptional activator
MGLFEFRILGPTEVLREGEPLSFRGSRERALMAVLILHANRTVSSERLVEDLWDGEAPKGAIRSLRVYVSRVRHTLRAPGELLVTRPAGYLLQTEPEAIDAVRFDSLVREGREQARAGDHQRAAATFAAALGLWRGPALAEVADAPFAQAEAIRLEEARLVALEERLEADLACGRHSEVAAELDALTRAHPFRERLWAQRMTALYRAGRQADALRAYQDLRRTLGDQLGIEPSSDLRRLERSVLGHDPELDWGPSGVEPERSTPRSPEGGVVTFLFTDVVGSTELLDQIGDDAAEETRQSHFRLLREAVTAHGGVEVKNLGDGLMIVFSSPFAALDCAVAMQQGVGRASPPPARPVAVRIGLHAGEPMRDEGDFFGTPVVVAKRLCDHAQGGQILASTLVWDLAGRRGDHTVAFRHLGGLALKGLAEPVAAGEIMWASDAEPATSLQATEPGPLPAPLAGTERLPLVGRAAEMARLEAAWAGTGGHQRRLLLLGGEPGIGKSRLMAEFAQRVHAEGATVLFGRCDEGMGVPYQPFVEALGRYLRETPSPVLGRLAGELARLVPEVAERAHGLPLPLRSDPETERYRLFEAVTAWLCAVAETRPVLFALDDLHWATKPTLLLLSHLIRSDDPISLLLLATYRDSPLDVTPEFADVVAELLRQLGVGRMQLSGLDEAGVAALMEAQARHELDEDGWALARVLHVETAGNPFFVREVLRHLTEKGAVVQRGGRWTAGQPVTEVDVPDSVREVVGRRLTRLPDKTDGLLAVAAVLGEHFELAELVEASGESQESVLRALDPAIAARLVDETAVGSYRFAHALIRSTLEEALGLTRRAQLHLRAAEALQSIYAGHIEGRAAVLATHYQKAGSLVSPERVVDALIQAGQEAAAVLAWEQVAVHWQAALELMDRTHSGNGRRADLLAHLADLLYVTGYDLEASIGHAEQAIALFAEVGDHQRVTVLRSRLGGYLTSNPVYGVMDIRRGLREFKEAEQVLAQAPESLAYGYLQGTLSAATGIWAARPEEALITAPRAVEIARRHGHDALGVMGEMLHAFALMSVGSVGEGILMVERAWESADRLDHRILGMRTTHIRVFWGLVLREPLVVIARTERELAKPRLEQVPIQRHLLLGQLAWGYALVGRLSDAQQVLDEVGGLPIGGGYAPPLELWKGDWQAAEAVLRLWRDRYREMGDRIDEVTTDGWIAEVCRLRGNPEGAEDSLQEALAIAVPARHRVFEAGFRLDLAILSAGQGDVDRACQEVERARELVADDWRGLIGRLALGEAATLAAGDDLQSAGAHFERAIEIFRRYMLPWDEAEALLLWGQALVSADPALSGEKLAAAAEVYRRCGAGGSWLARVEAERPGRP